MDNSERQIELENMLLSANVPKDKIDQIVDLIADSATLPKEPKKPDVEAEIRMKMLHEEDWRKKAAMAAMILSMSLE